MTMRHTGARRVVKAGCAVAALVLIAGCTNDGSKPDDSTMSETDGESNGLSVSVVAGRADFVSGDTVLLEVTPTEGATLDPANVDVVVDDQRAVAESGVGANGVLIGLADLTPGAHQVSVTSAGRSASLDLQVYPQQGPMFSGPHQSPLVCSTEANGLGPTDDPDCVAETQVRWRYITASGEVKPLESPTERPADAGTATVDGHEVPLIVRSESGVINRSVYWISFLAPDIADAADAGDVPKPNDAWNRRLIYQFGGGCGVSYAQGSSMVGGEPGFDVDLLKRGYALATATFNTFQVACNDVLSAETAVMVKQRVGQLLGPMDLTIGSGGSGGAIQQLLLAQNYPGILDAIVATVPFPDHFSIAPGVVDCGLLQHYFTADGAELTAEQRTAISGHATIGTCASWENLFLGNIVPSSGCDPGIPASEIYSPTNPDGTRCTLVDGNINLLGRDPATGFARRPLDNVGVEYGRQALIDNVITVDQFLNLNERIGGYDIDGRVQAERNETKPGELRALIESGRVNSGGGDLGAVPVLLLNIFSDPSGDIHDRFRSFSILERIKSGSGQSENVSLWTRGGGSLIAALTTAGRSYALDMIDAADEWATALLGTPGWKEGENVPHGGGLGRDALTEAIVDSRPDAAASNCSDDSGFSVIGDDAELVDGPCAEKFPVAGNSRIAAGAPISDDVPKCALRPADPTAYGVEFTDEQATRLATVFPDGVCDWDAPSPEESIFKRPWKRYGA